MRATLAMNPGFGRVVSVFATVVALVVPIAGCGGDQDADAARSAAKHADGATDRSAAQPYTVSANGGTPATGPGDRYNHCERIWCLTHKENFFIDHFLRGHVGWIIH